MLRRLSPWASLLLALVIGMPWWLSLLERAYGSLVVWILGWQRDFHRQLVETFTSLAERPSGEMVWSMMALSLAYGIFHAAGPGHGKAVIASYLVTQRTRLGRGIALSMLAAAAQALVAIITVAVLVFGFGWLASKAVASSRYLDAASFAMVATLGAWLAARAGLRLWRLRRAKSRVQAFESQPLGDVAGFQLVPPTLAARSGIGLAPSAHAKHSDACACCGVGHHIDPARLEGHWRDDAAAVLAIGLRPCSGALLVLSVAALLGQWLAGVLAVLAMGLGTGLTVSALAILSVYARDLMLRLGVRDGTRMLRLSHWLAMAGGVVLCLLGTLLLVASLTRPEAGSPFGF
ncbi:nickel/cobalt transporter [Halotalea alkalilenta]|uniref:nickel/cobalt transporter n=1 Tax=Halotalea alkalilenta TaxID=376489 RepID=UPI000694F6D7|nr:hypothetical protein [Halotalea alkalilenta]